MLKDIVAKRYAKALLSLASASGETAEIKKDLDAVAEAYQASRNLQSVVLNPVFTLEEKSGVLKGLAADLKVTKTSARFLDLLVVKGRFKFIREVAASYGELLDAMQGRVKATVTSASELTPAEVDRLKEKVKALVNKDVEVAVEVDPALIGGIKTRVGSTVYDGSLSNQMALVREKLLKG